MPFYRASVMSAVGHETDLQRCPQFGRCRGQTVHVAERRFWCEWPLPGMLLRNIAKSMLYDRSGRSLIGWAMTLRSAYFADWKGSPTVLLWGDATGMRELRDFLRGAWAAPNALALEAICDAVDAREIT